MSSLILRQILSLSLSSFCVLFGQSTPFVEDMSVDSAGFTTDEQSTWESLSEDTAFLSIRLVKISGIANALNGDSLSFILPGTQDTIRAVGMYLQHASDTLYTWWGAVEAGAGYVGISASPEGRLLFVSYLDDTYVFHPLSERYNVQAEIDQEAIPWDEPEIEVPDNITVEPPSCDMNYCKDVVNVLVLYTPEAINELWRFFNINQKSSVGPLYWALFPQTLNLALIQSGVVGKSARFVVEGFNFEFANPPSLNNDLNGFLIDTSAWNRFVANRADVMVLLTDDRYGSYAGVASAQVPIAIVTVNNLASPRYTFAHEVGHLFGALHNRMSNGGDEKDNPNNCNFGYRVWEPGYPDSFYTVMAQALHQSTKRQLFFSNPNIDHFGNSIGTAWDFNAAYVSETICAVASRYFDDDELSVAISGADSVCEEPVTYSLTIHEPGTGIPGVAPYSYKWFLGTGPFTTPLDHILTYGNTDQITVDVSSIHAHEFWIYASIHSSDGVMANDLLQVVDPCYQRPLPTLETTQYAAPIRMYPNPATNLLSMQLDRGVFPLSYRVINAYGQIMQSGRMDAWRQDERIDLPLQLIAGIYTIQVRTPTSSLAQKIIIQ